MLTETCLDAVKEVNHMAIERGESCPLQVIDVIGESLWVGLWKHGDLSTCCAALHDRFHLQIGPAKTCLMFRASVLSHFTDVIRITEKP